MSIDNKFYVIKVNDSLLCKIPLIIIAKNRASHFANEYNGDIEKSMRDDTVPLFLSDEYEIKDWAQNNMNWSDVKEFSEFVHINPDQYMSKAWLLGGYVEG